MKHAYSQRIIRFLTQSALILLFILLSLEIMTRLIWWDGEAVIMFDKKIYLLPQPLVTRQQLESLEIFSKAKHTYNQFDPDLGWSIRPNAAIGFDDYRYTANSIGLRSLREYELLPPAGITRIAAFGPSFTHGDEVDDHETWEAQMEQVRPDLEVMNWGVGAYGTDQAFLRYKIYGKAYHPDIVIIGYEEDNLYRNVNRFHPFYNREGLPLAKPVYVANAGSLILIQNPFDSFDDFYNTIRYDWERFLDLICPADYFCNEQLYRPYLLDMMASFRFFRTFKESLIPQSRPDLKKQIVPQEVSLQLIRMFIAEVTYEGAKPIVVFFPTSFKTLSNYEQGILPNYHQGVMIGRDLMGIEVIDLAETFVKVKQEQGFEYQDFFVREDGPSHYSPLGNQVVAQAILEHSYLHRHLEKDLTPKN